MHANQLWSIWQALLQSFAGAFTRPGHRRFAEWVTALALNVEEHTITQSTLAIERPADWKAMETFAESGVNIPDDMLHYGFTKTAVLALSRGLAKLARGTGVTVNAVLPGPIACQVLLADRSALVYVASPGRLTVAPDRA